MTPRTARSRLLALTDVELVERAQIGCQDALHVVMTRYRRFARAKARGYFLVGGDHDDVEQQALIGLYKAARDFRAEHRTSFRTFAELCINRQIVTAVKAATRQKHQALNQYVSLSGADRVDDAGARDLEEVVHRGRLADDPADDLVAAERLAALRDRLSETLSPLEVEVLPRYVAGLSYAEISEQVGRHVKAIDNAVQRIKRKLEAQLAELAEADRGDDLALTA